MYVPWVYGTLYQGICWAIAGETEIWWDGIWCRSCRSNRGCHWGTLSLTGATYKTHIEGSASEAQAMLDAAAANNASSMHALASTTGEIDGAVKKAGMLAQQQAAQQQRLLQQHHTCNNGHICHSGHLSCEWLTSSSKAAARHSEISSRYQLAHLDAGFAKCVR